MKVYITGGVVGIAGVTESAEEKARITEGAVGKIVLRKVL